MNRVMSKACSVAWAIRPESLQQILEIAGREHRPDWEAVEARRARMLDGSQSVTMRSSVAVIDVTGPIFRYADMFTEMSGATSVSSLARDFNTALEDPKVSAILLNIDSPGGEVAGIHEFAQMVYAGRAAKPIVAYVDGMAASAAYWIASATDHIVIDATAMLGSIGVVATVPNPDVKSAKEIQFVSSQSPRKRPNPNTEAGRDQLQQMVDDLAAVFIATVARNRSVSAETVVTEFGQGAMFVGTNAIDAGLADRLGSFESIVAELARGEFKPKTRASAQAALMEDDEMKAAEMLDKIKVLITGQSPEDPVDPAEEEGPVEEPESAIDLAKIAAIEDENARLKADLVAQRRAQIETEAETFISLQIAAGKVLPAESEAILAQYRQAAADDAVMPMSEGTRVARLVAMVDARPSHQLFDNLIASADARTLHADENAQTELSEERRQQLLQMTPLGAAALKVVK